MHNPRHVFYCNECGYREGIDKEPHIGEEIHTDLIHQFLENTLSSTGCCPVCGTGKWAVWHRDNFIVVE